jgi:hypothetical protein
MHADLFSVKCLGRDVGDKLVRLAGTVRIVIVTQSKIAKFHISLPLVLISFEPVTYHVASNLNAIATMAHGTGFQLSSLSVLLHRTTQRDGSAIGRCNRKMVIRPHK